jgi:hypothetical protein
MLSEFITFENTNPSYLWIVTRCDWISAGVGNACYNIKNKDTAPQTLFYTDTLQGENPFVTYFANVPLQPGDTFTCQQSGDAACYAVAYATPYPLFYSLPAATTVTPAG